MVPGSHVYYQHVPQVYYYPAGVPYQGGRPCVGLLAGLGCIGQTIGNVGQGIAVGVGGIVEGTGAAISGIAAGAGAAGGGIASGIGNGIGGVASGTGTGVGAVVGGTGSAIGGAAAAGGQAISGASKPRLCYSGLFYLKFKVEKLPWN